MLRVAYTTNGVDFSTTGLANGGVISGQGIENGSSYNDISNPDQTSSPANLNQYTPGTADATEMRFVGSAGSIVVNPDGSYGLFLSGAWAADGDSDSFNQVFYSSSTNGETWTTPVDVVSTDYTFAASVAQEASLGANCASLPQGCNAALGISAYYSGRAYAPVGGPESERNAHDALRRRPCPEVDRHGGRRPWGRTRTRCTPSGPPIRPSTGTSWP